MVAVVMGISSFATVAMATPSSGDPKHNPKVGVCHFDLDPDSDIDTDDAAWVVKQVNKHSKIAHNGHGDPTIADATDLPDFITVADCTGQLLSQA